MNNLIKIQNEIKVLKSNFNKFGNYKYRTAEDIESQLKPLLEKYNCIFYLSDEVKQAGNYVFIESTAKFIDGDFIVEVKSQAGIDNEKGIMSLAQSFGSSSSYARKYAMSALFLLDDVADDDVTNRHQKEDKEQIKELIQKASSIKELTKLYNENPIISKSKDLMMLMGTRKVELL